MRGLAVTASVGVRPLASGHRVRVAEILAATGVFRAAEVDVALELFDEAVPESSHTLPASADYFFLGAFTPEDALVGFACYGPTPATDRTWDLYWIAVDPAARGAGGGTTLLLEVERRLRQHDARMLVIETSSRSEYEAARHFYAARGCTVAGRVRDFYAPADDRIILTKRIQTSPAEGRGAVAP